MKEISIEEKARRYDEAKYIMKEYLESGNAGIIAENTIRKAFPELMESEDERIRKALMQNLKERFGTKGNMGEGLDMPDVLAWLEKQGERKHADSYCQENCKGFQETGKCFADGECKAKREAEQNTAWSEEDKNTIQVLKNIVRHSDEIDENIYTMSLKEKLYDWLKSIKNRVLLQPKQEWSEEDKKMSRFVGNAITSDDSSIYLKSKGIQVIDAHVWLDELKDRIQPNQEWSKEDEKYVDDLIAYFTAGMSLKHTEEDIVNWLKSLRPQSQWKPSDEQIKVLEFFIPYVTKCSIVLEKSKGTLLSLLSDLKKLKD